MRDRDRGLPGREGRRPDRGLRDTPRRARAYVALPAYLLALTIHLHLPDNGSLKGKRRELLAIRSGLARHFGASVAEVEHHELWQRSTLAAALVGGSPRDLEQAAGGVERYLQSRYPETVRVERRLVSFADIS